MGTSIPHAPTAQPLYTGDRPPVLSPALAAEIREAQGSQHCRCGHPRTDHADGRAGCTPPVGDCACTHYQPSAGPSRGTILGCVDRILDAIELRNAIDAQAAVAELRRALETAAL